MVSPSGPIRLAAFDVDGTVLHGPTICEYIAAGIGRGAEMAALERLTFGDDVRRSREIMARWYRSHSRARLIAALAAAQPAAGLADAFSLLRAAGVKIALVSVSWRFAVEALAARWGADLAFGTGLSEAGAIDHVWPADKAVWL